MVVPWLLASHVEFFNQPTFTHWSHKIDDIENAQNLSSKITIRFNLKAYLSID